MNRVALFLICTSIVAAGCGQSSGPAQQSTDSHGVPSTDGNTSSASQVIYVIKPEPPKVGSNELLVTVLSPDGTPVADARVTVTLSMPPMPSMGMPEMHTTADLASEGSGKYHGMASFSMAGTWHLAIKIARSGQVVAERQSSVIVK